MQRVRLIACDLDGTLLGPDDRVSARTRAALAAAREAGIHVVAATGRGRRTAVPALADCPEIELVVCSNGSMVYDAVNARVVEHFPVPAAAAAALFAALAEHVPGGAAAWEALDGYGWHDSFHLAEPDIAAIIRTVAAGDPQVGWDTSPLIKVYVAHPTRPAEELQGVLAAVLPEGATVAHLGLRYVEVKQAGVDKTYGLARVCERLGVAREEVVAFGDHLNDLEMLAWAGRGVAMANAHPEVLARCAETAPHHAEDGVAQAVERLLAER